MISVMIITRNSPEKLHECIASLYDNCSNFAKAEIIIKVDIDTDDFSLCREILDSFKFKYKIIAYDRLRGYVDLCWFWNDVAALSSGNLLWMLTDDAVVIRGDWVRSFHAISKFNKSPAFVVYPNFYASLYKFEKDQVSTKPHGWPVISRGFYEAIGRHLYPPGVCGDRYIRDIASLSKTIIKDRNVCVLHDVNKKDPEARKRGGTNTVLETQLKGGYESLVKRVIQFNRRALRRKKFNTKK